LITEKLLHGHRNHMTRDNVIFIHEGRVAGGARTFQGVRFFDRDQNARRIDGGGYTRLLLLPLPLEENSKSSGWLGEML
jgi:hypothetical protein